MDHKLWPANWGTQQWSSLVLPTWRHGCLSTPHAFLGLRSLRLPPTPHNALGQCPSVSDARFTLVQTDLRVAPQFLPQQIVHVHGTFRAGDNVQIVQESEKSFSDF